MEAETRFRAMGTDVHVVVVGGRLTLLETAREFVDYLEGRWSRFRPTSEVSLLNQLAGQRVRVSAWTVGIEHPLPGRPMGTVGLRSGAVATSTRVRRTWGPSHDRRHHLIDPTTGRPAWTGVASVTVVAAQAWQAEVVAKAAFVAGLSEGLVVLASTGTEGLLVDDDGSVYPSYGFDRFAGPTIAPRARVAV